MKYLLTLTFILYFLVTFAIQLIEVPTVRLFETAICDRYYRSVENTSRYILGDIDETSCKVPVVQNELTKVVGWKVSFDAIPGHYILTLTRCHDGTKSCLQVS